MHIFASFLTSTKGLRLVLGADSESYKYGGYALRQNERDLTGVKTFSELMPFELKLLLACKPFS
jgi:hypothetical protein